MENLKRICKLLRDILKNPKNVKFEDMDKLLKELGFEVKQPKGGSSHYNYRKKGFPFVVTIPKDVPLKVTYVKLVIKRLKLEDYYNENCKGKKK
jgi:predicted RNA binding protein YcfA (HicA-like mRNA interferase family)